MPFGRPFRAISCVSFPGLKPWTVFCSPVGRLELAQENVQTPGTSCPATIVLSLRDEPLCIGSQALRAWPGVWTFSCASSKRPTGEEKTAQGFSPGNDTHKDDHVHILSSLSRNIAFAEMIGRVKESKARPQSGLARRESWALPGKMDTGLSQSASRA